MEHFTLDRNAPATPPADRLACAAVIASIVLTAACSAFAILVQSDPPLREAGAMEAAYD
ncbi:MAG TPA: hypothetical protein VFJ62_07715 [Usitatibacter sp.]|nr:hypothetical protein [Usitatibacter sp.]